MKAKNQFNVANATSENVNVVNTTSNESTKRNKKMTLDESFKKRITKDGEYRTTYKIKEVDNIIKEAMEYKCFLESVNNKKNVVQIVGYAKKRDLTNEQIDELMKEFAAMKTAA